MAKSTRATIPPPQVRNPHLVNGVPGDPKWIRRWSKMTVEDAKRAILLLASPGTEEYERYSPFIRDLAISDLLDYINFRSAGRVHSPETEARLQMADHFLLVFERAASLPMVVGFGSHRKEEPKEKLEQFLRYFFVALVLMGGSVHQGSGPAVMEMIAREQWNAIRAVGAFLKAKGRRWSPRYGRSRVVSTALHVEHEYPHKYTSKGFFTGPWTNLENRSKALLALGIMLGVLTAIGGDSTLLELLIAHCARKGYMMEQLAGPLSGFPTPYTVTLLDDEKKLFWKPFLALLENMASVRVTEGDRAVKAAEIQIFTNNHIVLNGDPPGESRKCFARYMATWGYFVNEDPIQASMEHNGLYSQNFWALVEEILEWAGKQKGFYRK